MKRDEWMQIATVATRVLRVFEFAVERASFHLQNEDTAPSPEQPPTEEPSRAPRNEPSTNRGEDDGQYHRDTRRSRRHRRTQEPPRSRASKNRSQEVSRATSERDMFEVLIRRQDAQEKQLEQFNKTVDSLLRVVEDSFNRQATSSAPAVEPNEPASVRSEETTPPVDRNAMKDDEVAPLTVVQLSARRSTARTPEDRDIGFVEAEEIAPTSVAPNRIRRLSCSDTNDHTTSCIDEGQVVMYGPGG